VNDRDAVLSYVFAQEGLGAVNIQIVVDGIPNFLGPDYVVGVGPVNLGDAYDDVPAGTQYIVSAAFLTPLTKGDHTVQLKGNLAGALGFGPIDVKFQVTVR
jgi:hypothetical protein